MTEFYFEFQTLSGPSHSFSTSHFLMVEESEKQYTVTTEEDGIRTVCLNDPKKR